MQVPDGVGWKGDAAPKVVAGLQIEKIASNLKHPRQLLVLPNGDVLVVEGNGPGEEAVTTPKQVIAGKVKGKFRQGRQGRQPRHPAAQEARRHRRVGAARLHREAALALRHPAGRRHPVSSRTPATS
jgi:glucose/arabinose dehydrogenase